MIYEIVHACSLQQDSTVKALIIKNLLIEDYLIIHEQHWGGKGEMGEGGQKVHASTM